MTGLQVRQLNRGQARVIYFKDNEAVFPKDSPGEKVMTAMEVVIADIQADAARQVSGEVSQRIDIKDEDFLKLKKIMRKMNRGGKSMAEEIEGIENLYRLPYGEAEEVWLAKARAFHANSVNHVAQMQDYDLAPTFREDLMAVITRIEVSMSGVDSAKSERGGATGSLEANFRELGRLGRKANNIVMNKYEDDPEKLAAWFIASHLKAAPKSTEAEPPA